MKIESEKYAGDCCAWPLGDCEGDISRVGSAHYGLVAQALAEVHLFRSIIRAEAGVVQWQNVSFPS